MSDIVCKKRWGEIATPLVCVQSINFIKFYKNIYHILGAFRVSTTGLENHRLEASVEIVCFIIAQNVALLCVILNRITTSKLDSNP